MKIGVILDNVRVRKWQAEALSNIAAGSDFLIYNCTNAPTPKRRLRHAPYYALNLISLRTRQTAVVPLPDELRIVDRFDFECECDGTWERLPPALIDRINADDPDLIVKFGMGLLRVPPDLRPPVLSYHHGDPRAFRGRPAGFYELMAGRGAIGQVVQILSDRLDSGEVVAFAETRAHAHSWRRTMAEAYRASPLLLPNAIGNVLAGNRVEMERSGKNYRLPSAMTVFRFLAKRVAAGARHLAYGAFYEKAWEVAEAPLVQGTTLLADFPARDSWRCLPRPRGYLFLADPFPHPSGGLLVEALRSKSGLGEILHLNGEGHRVLLSGKGHYSFPGITNLDGQTYLLPEVSEWSPPLLFRLSADAAMPIGELKVPGRPRLIDPALFERNGTIFLFANRADEGFGVLRLWCADRVDGQFAEHPASPIRISPAGARMAGAILERNGELFRIGQDFRRRYGDGVIQFRIDQLSPTAYQEKEIGSLRFADVRGPHTVNFGAGSVMFDFYRDRLSLLAGLRRLRSALLS